MKNTKIPAAGTVFAMALCAMLGLPSAASAQSLGVCNSFYSSGFTLAEGKVNPAQPAMNKPAKGTVFREPNFNTCVVRATDHAAEPPTTFARNDYSRRQAFNADNTYFIIYSNDGWWHLYDANTLKHLRKLSPRVPNPSTPAQYHMAGDAEPQWHPTDPNILYYLPTNGGTKLLKLDVRTNAYSVAADFAGKLPSWGSSASHIWTKSEGSPSADGRYWGFQVENSNFGLLGYMVWDLQENRLVGSMQNSSRPDHSSMSAAGRWFITSSDSTGTWAWSRDFSTKKKLLSKSEHSDLALGPNGQDYYVSIDYQSNNGDVFFIDIDACPAVAASATSAPLCPRTVLFPTYSNGSATALHVSGKGMRKPGWVVISTYGTTPSRNGQWPWYTNKIFAVELKANPRVYPLAYTRSGGGGYWAEPHASVSRDFTRIIFNSNWGTSGDNIDAYIVHIPPSALPGGTSPPPPSGSGPVTGGRLPALVADNNRTAAASDRRIVSTSSGNNNTPATSADTASGNGSADGGRVAITPAAVIAYQRIASLLLSRAYERSPEVQEAARLASVLPVAPYIGWSRLSWTGLSHLRSAFDDIER
jgi:hypothetical protein